MTGRVLDSDGRPVPDTLVEIWQANAAGRYAHRVDDHPAPLDPNFDGAGRCLTDSERRYRFVTIKPGAYPWGNHLNAWRPAHIHFSLFGQAFTQRLVTQMYFPGDPLFGQDPIFNSMPDAKARERLIARFDLELTEPEWALGYRWDIVLRGREADRLRGKVATGAAADHAVADRRAVPGDRAAVAGRAVRRAGGDAGRDHDHRPGHRRRTISRCRTRWSRPGRPTRTAGSTIADDPRGAARVRGRLGSAGSAGARPTREGRYRIVTVRPGRAAERRTAVSRRRTSTCSVFARGLLDRVVTRIYFPDEAAANAADPVLAGIVDPDRRHTLIASPAPGGQAG